MAAMTSTHWTDVCPVPIVEATSQKRVEVIVEYIRYNVEPSRAAEFLAAYEAASASMKASSYCLGYELSQCTDAKEHYILRILWDSHEGHLKGFRTSAEEGSRSAVHEVILGLLS